MDTKYNEQNNLDKRQSLELRRNLSRSLDVRLSNDGNDHVDDDDDDQKTNINRSVDQNTFSPLPSRRRTQKLDEAPLMDTSRAFSAQTSAPPAPLMMIVVS